MNPFFFGTSERRLFGVYTPGRSGGAGGRVAVLCHPWGQEYLRAYRSMRHLAALLNRADVDVLRFDYFGTGDSGGDITDGDLAGWQRDVEMAIDEIRDTTGAARVGLVGLRLGGALAAAVAARRPEDVHCLVLWDPVVNGADYAHELLHASSPGATEGAREVFGFLLPERILAEFRSVDLLALVPSLPARTLVVFSEAQPSHVALAERLTATRGRSAAVEQIPSAYPWVEHEHTGVGAIPVHVLQRIVQWWG